MICITKTFEFAASHKLWRAEWDEKRNQEAFGLCANLHGHNYLLEVCLKGELNSEDKMVLDSRLIKQIVSELVVADLDHKHLNDVAWLNGELPTAEVLVAAIWDRIAPALSKERPGVSLRRVRLWETRTIYAEREE